MDKRGRNASGLDRGAFSVYEDDVKQEIGFFSNLDTPASIGVIFDVSDSMSGEKMNRSREALARFIRTSHPEDEYSLITFNDSAKLLLDRLRDGGALLSQFAGASPNGNTALFPNNTEAMSEDFEQIALELRQQYSIGYVPANITNDGRWRRLKVIVRPPAESQRLIVRSRKGYYPGTKLAGRVGGN